MNNICIKMGSFLKKNSLTILTLTISILTLFIYVRQTNILVQQTKANSWPFLILGKKLIQNINESNNLEINILEVDLVNKGTGPAIIESVVIKMGGEEFEDWTDLYNAVSITDSSEISHMVHPVNEQVLMPGEKIVIISWNENPKLAGYLAKKLVDLEISICYKSIHEDFWTVSRKNFYGFGKTSRKQSKKCDLKAKTYFKL